MSKNIDHVQHIKSNVVVEGKPKIPQPSALVDGELAVNYATGFETISLKNASGDIVTFSSDNYYTKQKLGSGFTGENSANTVTSVIESNERVTAAALNDLKENKLDASAYTPTDLSDYYTKEETDARDLWVSGTGENAIVQKGSSSVANGNYAVAEGYQTSATSNSSHAEGAGTTASGNYSHAEGAGTTASGVCSHAEGNSTKANGFSSHAEGAAATASGSHSHAEGAGTTASGNYSHAEGGGTTASGNYSHAEGGGTTASGNYSHAEGNYTMTNNQSEHASGQYNVSNSATTTFGDSGNTLFSVGNGTFDNARHNAFEIRQNGDIYIVSGNSDIKLQDYIGGGGSITVDQVLDDTTSASTNPVSSKAVYDAVTDNELVWTNAYVTLSGAVSSHTANNDIHVTAADKAAWNNVSNKVDTSAFTAHTADSVVHITSAERTIWNAKLSPSNINQVIDSSTSASTSAVSTSAVYDFVTGYAPQITVDQTIDSGTSASTNAVSTKAVYDFITNDFYTKEEVDNGDEAISSALNDLNTRKADASAVTEAITDAISGKCDTSAFTAHTADTTIHFTTGDVQSQISDALTALSIASSAVTSMEGYTMAASGTPITTADTLNQAIGKLEKQNDEVVDFIEEKELAIAAAITDLDDRKLDKSTNKVTVTAITTNKSSSCSITGASNDGNSETIIYTNSTNSNLIVTVPTTYKTPNNAALEIICLSGGYCEVSYINVNGVIYARAI